MPNQSRAILKGRASFIAVLLLISGAAAAVGQTGGGATLVGTVKDSTGSVVAGAKVKVVNTETSFLTETTTQTGRRLLRSVSDARELPGDGERARASRSSCGMASRCGRRKCRASISFWKSAP